ncbi:glycosyltransferase [Butyrivibrio sp. VCD2006]|uniref:glycosyltransferase n=1 Tax=Butyrivibrio sp. VCD2006 TaxID=1280664 RepID=UPI00040057A4|nr:glycosyltransferase [Butyrivibrio sp. VCD2006]
MNILYINTNLYGGGAEKIARVLFKGMQQYGNNTYFMEGKHTKGSDVPYVYPQKGLLGCLNTIVKVLTNNARIRDYRARYLIRKMIKDYDIDIVHFHNIHGNYIGVSDLAYFTKYCHVVWTLHDQWAITAHCAYSIECEKWKTDCAKCPHRNLYPKVFFSDSKKMFERKMQSYSSEIFIITPSKWLYELVNQSALQNNRKMIINNGVDLNCFKFIKKELDHNKIRILFGSNSNRSSYKNIGTVIHALHNLKNKAKFEIHIFGGPLVDSLPKEYEIIEHGKINDENEMASLYAASDVFILPSAAENYSCAILESLSCGTPVMASDVGGNSEIVNEHNGWLFSLNNDDLCSMLDELSFQDILDKNSYISRTYQILDQNKMFEMHEQLYSSLLC